MNDTDRLVAAIFAATRGASESNLKARDFLGFYDECMAEIHERETLEAALREERKIDAQNKAWG